MSTRQKNRLKAIFLLVVFSMNTLAGFACSIGVDMGYNDHHHIHESLQVQKKCTGHQKTVLTHLTTATSFKDMSTDDCCSNAVTTFNLLDKLVIDNTINCKVPFFPIALPAAYFMKSENKGGTNVNSLFQFLRRSCSLDDTDIRIAIQSFQI